MPTGGRVEESCVQIQLEKKERKLSQGRNMYYAQTISTLLTVIDEASPLFFFQMLVKTFC